MKLLAISLILSVLLIGCAPPEETVRDWPLKDAWVYNQEEFLFVPKGSFKNLTKEQFGFFLRFFVPGMNYLNRDDLKKETPQDEDV